MSHYTLNNAIKIFSLKAGQYTHDQIKKTYRKLASENHPDKGGLTTNMQKINSAQKELYSYFRKNKVLFVDTVIKLKRTHASILSSKIKIKSPYNRPVAAFVHGECIGRWASARHAAAYAYHEENNLELMEDYKFSVISRDGHFTGSRFIVSSAGHKLTRLKIRGETLLPDYEKSARACGCSDDLDWIIENWIKCKHEFKTIYNLYISNGESRAFRGLYNIKTKNFVKLKKRKPPNFAPYDVRMYGNVTVNLYDDDPQNEYYFKKLPKDIFYVYWEYLDKNSLTMEKCQVNLIGPALLLE